MKNRNDKVYWGAPCIYYVLKKFT